MKSVKWKQLPKMAGWTHVLASIAPTKPCYNHSEGIGENGDMETKKMEKKTGNEMERL